MKFGNIWSKKDFNRKMQCIGVRLSNKNINLNDGMNGMYQERQVKDLEVLCDKYNELCYLMDLENFVINVQRYKDTNDEMSQ